MTDFSRFSLEGKTAIITGGSGGIGRGCARAFAKAGANLVIASVPPEEIPPAIAEVEALGVQAIGVTVDISNAAQVSEMVKQSIRNVHGVKPMGPLDHSRDHKTVDGRRPSGSQ